MPLQPQKLIRSWPWNERSPLLFVLTPNVLAENDGAPGVGWLNTLLFIALPPG